ncbi:MAG: Rrf2 family transcriptional regulator [Candidatus Moraniibacteriota bacterium]
MKVSKKAYYGLRAVVALAHAGKSLSIHVLAESEQLPEDYLEKILQTLRRAGIVEATKGTAGGYALAHATRDISVWDVLRELDGPIKTFTAPKGELPCFHVSHCQTNEVWRALENKIEETLADISVDSLIPKNIEG